MRWREPDWSAEPSCRGMDANVFFPDPSDTAGNRKAKAVCERCPVKAECLEWAIEVNPEYGVFGGLDARERGSERRRRRRVRERQRITA